MRIIAGSCRGLALKAPADVTRPTSDRVREAIFSMLQFVVKDAVVLDLFAGTGAMGIEALSRGARHCTFVENNAKALRVLKANLSASRLEARATVSSQDALRFLTTASLVDLVIADPPYFRDGSPDWSAPLLSSRLPLKVGGYFLLEVESERVTPEDVPRLKLLKRKDYGSTAVLLFEHVV